MCRVLQTIEYSYTQPLMRNIRRLFMYIVNYGEGVIGFRDNGNVVINGHTVKIQMCSSFCMPVLQNQTRNRHQLALNHSLAH